MILVLGIWEGNRLLQPFVQKKRTSSIARSLLRQFLLSLAIIGLLTILGTFSFQFLLETPTSLSSIKLLLGFNFRINLFLHSINAIIAYNNELSNTKVEAEKLKKETSEAQFESLRNQLNPHFLFNSFNVLSSLIESDSKMAVQFVDQLSRVYRYSLKTQKLKVVSLKEEIEFLSSYLFLLKIRFQSNLNINLAIEESEISFVPPSTLQMLIENAIKHNEVSKQNPLKIDLYQAGDVLVVKNNLSPKLNPEESSQVGLKNIQSRYNLLGGKAPKIEKTADEFIVSIPLLNQK